MMRCDHCTADAVVISPGTDEVRNLFLLAAGAPDRCWCLACWAKKYAPDHVPEMAKDA